MISIYSDIIKDALYPKKKGVISVRNKYIKLAPLEDMSPAEIKKLRLSLHLSASLFADLLGVSVKTVQAWESGVNKPQGSSLRLMNMLRRYPDILIETGAISETGIR